ncbi:PREDICTED: transcription factor IIIB 90 kDa subunit [Myotis davidii]|uniref:transcription factor IIIB 90 kDa subunit n=1 Tax=Myotis davidii TaxID=225400 RepID=UPI0007676181|nr:PREDICTED: transcription factor IIIB 90 kDa subunit [Myotis davidii]
MALRLRVHRKRALVASPPRVGSTRACVSPAAVCGSQGLTPLWPEPPRIGQSAQCRELTSGRRHLFCCLTPASFPALLVAARMHDFRRTVKEVISVVKVCESTLRKRWVAERRLRPPSGSAGLLVGAPAQRGCPLPAQVPPGASPRPSAVGGPWQHGGLHACPCVGRGAHGGPGGRGTGIPFPGRPPGRLARAWEVCLDSCAHVPWSGPRPLTLRPWPLISPVKHVPSKVGVGPCARNGLQAPRPADILVTPGPQLRVSPLGFQLEQVLSRKLEEVEGEISSYQDEIETELENSRPKAKGALASLARDAPSSQSIRLLAQLPWADVPLGSRSQARPALLTARGCCGVLHSRGARGLSGGGRGPGSPWGQILLPLRRGHCSSPCALHAHAHAHAGAAPAPLLVRRKRSRRARDDGVGGPEPAERCASLEDASGDGELDLSGIDDLEIDRYILNEAEARRERCPGSVFGGCGEGEQARGRGALSTSWVSPAVGLEGASADLCGGSQSCLLGGEQQTGAQECSSCSPPMPPSRAPLTPPVLASRLRPMVSTQAAKKAALGETLPPNPPARGCAPGRPAAVLVESGPVSYHPEEEAEEEDPDPEEEDGEPCVSALQMMGGSGYGCDGDDDDGY